MLTARNIASHLGVSLVVADRIEGLVNGRIDPKNFRSIQPWAEGTLGAPPKHHEVLNAIRCLLEGTCLCTVNEDDNEIFACVGFAPPGEQEDVNMPTVGFRVAWGTFVLTTLRDM